MKLSKLALIGLSMGMCSFTQAETVNASIELSLTIPKKCTIATPTTRLVLPTTGEEVSTTYSVTCNTGYTLGTTADNYSTTNWATNVKNGNLSLRTVMGTKGPNNSSIRIQYPATSFSGSSVDTYTLSASLMDKVTAITTAGTYTDQYRVTVTY